MYTHTYTHQYNTYIFFFFFECTAHFYKLYKHCCGQWDCVSCISLMGIEPVQPHQTLCSEGPHVWFKVLLLLS